MSSSSVFLLKKRRFLPLFFTQFFGAFNDNAYKLAMLTLISYHLSRSQEQSELYQAMAGILYILPFILFSATSGQLADKYDKALITRLIKMFELLLMIPGALAFYYGSIFLMMVTLTGLGIHSTFFGPIKYAILPDHLQKQELLGATGLIEASTFMAILFGTTLGSVAIGSINQIPYVAICMTLLAALLGLISSLFIPDASSSAPESLKVDFHVWRATTAMLKNVWGEPKVMLALLTLSWFWLIGAVILTKLPDYTHYVLNANTTVFAVFLSLFSIGIALGSLIINRILKGRITLAMVPLALFVFSCFMFDLYWASPVGDIKKPLLGLFGFFTYIRHWRIALDLVMLAFCAGLFVVPLYTYLQVASKPDARARTIAVNNIYNALFMVLGTLMVMVLLYFNIAIPHVFLIFSILNLFVVLFLWLFLRKQDKSGNKFQESSI